MKVMQLVVGLTVGVLLMVGLVVPVTNDGVDASVEEFNNSDGIYAAAPTTETVTFDFKYVDGAPVWSINGETVEIQTGILLLTSSYIFTVDPTGTPMARFIGDGYGRQDNVTVFNGTLSNGTITGSFTGANGNYNISRAYDWAFYAANSGEWRSININDSQEHLVYVSSVNDIYTGNYDFTNSTFFIGHGETVRLGNGNKVTANIATNPVDGVTGVYSINLGTNTDGYTYTVGDYTTHPYFFIVPAEVTGELVEGGSVYAALLKVIPILGFIALIAFAAFAVRGRMND